ASAGTWVYQSFDLLNWTNYGQVAGISPNWNWHYRPKVLFNKTYNYYVKWEDLATSTTSALGCSTSSLPTGPFIDINTNAHPWGETKDGDIGILQKPDGTSFLFCNTNITTGGLAVIQ